MSLGLATTAACPAFAYQPQKSAEVVRRLVEAGAIVVGKTNLDQFATGLVGVRSPYGVPRNPFDASFIPGGSSSGSAVAVAAGLVSFSLGTDTAGSGRVPAGFNNIVGLKPTLGLVSNEGSVPACRSLDCMSVFALSCADADAVLKVMAEPHTTPAIGETFRFGMLGPKDAEFFGDEAYAALYAQAIGRLEGHGRHGGRDRLCALSRRRRFALQRTVGGRANGGGRRVHRRRPRDRYLAGHARDHPARPHVQRRRCLRRPVQARRFQGACRGRERGPRLSHAADRGHDLSCRRHRARADAPQHPARPLHQLREFLRPLGSRLARGLPARRPALRHHPDRPTACRARPAGLRRALATRPAAAARQDPAVPCRRPTPIRWSSRIACRSPSSART